MCCLVYRGKEKINCEIMDFETCMYIYMETHL